MTIPLSLEGAFSSKEALHEMIVHRKACFDHDLFYVEDGTGNAEVLLQIPIFDRAHFGAESDRHVQGLRASTECLLKQLGARRGCWEEQNSQSMTAEESCEGYVAAAEAARRS